MSDLEDLMAEEEKGLTKAEKRDLKVSRLSDTEFARWAGYQIAKGDAMRAREAHQEGGTGAPAEDEIARMDDAQFRRFMDAQGLGLKGTNFEPTLSEEMGQYRNDLDAQND